MRVILAAVDLGAGAGNVLEGAVALARRAEADLHVVHVSESVGPDAASSHSTRTIIAHEREELAVLVQRCSNGRRVESQLVSTGRPAEGILERSTALVADLIVLGAHTEGELSARIFGTTADRVVRASTVPCLIMRTAFPRMLKLIAVPTDFSAESVAAARVAVEWLRLLGEPASPPQLHLLHVARPIDRMDNPDVEERTLRPRLAEIVEQLGTGSGSPVRPHVLWSNRPAVAIREWSRTYSCDLLVLGTRGETGLRERLLGSVAIALAREAPCPVLLVPSATPVRAGARDPGRAASEGLRSGAAAQPRPAGSVEPRLSCVVTGVDFSATSLAAADWIHTIAPDARHVLIHVTEPPDPAEYAVGGAELRAQLVARAQADANARLTRLFPELPSAGRQTTTGRASDELIRSAHESSADLICIGGHTHPRGLWEPLGKTADQLLRRSRVPVLIVRGRPDAAPARILATVDNSPECLQVLRWAGALSRRFGAQLQVVHVLSSLYAGAAKMVSGIVAGSMLEGSFAEQAEAWLRNQIVKAGLDASISESHVMTGEPTNEILALQENWRADLLVLGSRGAGAISRALIGSVASSVVRGATCPVLLVRHDTD